VGLITPKSTPKSTPEPIDQIDLSDTIIVDTSPNMASPILVSDASPDTSPDSETLTTPTITRFESTVLHTRKTKDTTQGVDKSNILKGIRTRKPRRQAYITALERPEELRAFHTSFLVGTTEMRKRVHRTELPDAPRV
jgi:hypothetical protein